MSGLCPYCGERGSLVPGDGLPPAVHQAWCPMLAPQHPMPAYLQRLEALEQRYAEQRYPEIRVSYGTAMYCACCGYPHLSDTERCPSCDARWRDSAPVPTQSDREALETLEQRVERLTLRVAELERERRERQ